MSLQEKLLAAFDIEHRTVLEKIRASLAFLETPEGQGSDPKTSLEEAFRMAHSLKGAARVVDFKTVMNLAHHMETLFALIRQGQVPLSGEIISLFHQVLDEVEDCVQAIQGGTDFVGNPALVAALEEKIGQSPETGTALPVPMPAISSGSSLLPSDSQAVGRETPLAPHARGVAKKSTGPISAENLRVSAAHLDRMLQTAGALATAALATQGMASAYRSISKRVGELDQEWMRVRMSSGKLLRQRKQDPEVMKLVSFFEFAEHEIKALVREVAVLKRRQQRNGRELAQVGIQLETDIQHARLVPAESVFEGFNKMMRDLALEHGKKIEFRALGLSEEADRYVLQELKDPLMHLLRNTLAHGLEDPAGRIAAGKPPVGRVTLKLESIRGRLQVTLEDDGRGLDFDRIRATAVQHRLVTADAVAQLLPDQLTALIFHAGFSTSTEVNDLSGRGMGLSVVQESIRRLQGDIQVTSEPGKNCRFTLSVPVVIASHRVLLARSGTRAYAIPCRGIQALVRTRVEDIQNVDGISAVFHQGEMIAITSLAELVGVADTRPIVRSDQRLNLIILHSAGHRLGVVADELLSERQAVIKNMPTPELAALPYVRGAIALDDGSACLVLDVSALVKNPGGRFRLNSLAISSGVVESTPAELNRIGSEETSVNTPMRRILVVDDSFTTRTLEKSILEANGYEVTLAVDGLEALQKLQCADFDLVISDVEMPRMTGFELLAEVKKNPRLQRIPIIMVTSLASPQDQERGLILGADAYIAKQKFDQGTLLEVVRQIL